MAVDHNNPQSRDEEILIATIDGTEYNKLPQSRMEELLLELKEVIEEGGGGGGSVHFVVVEELPTTDIDQTAIYLVPKSTAVTSNIYDEYINTDGTTSGWELIGSTDIDLSDYITDDDLATVLEDYATEQDLSGKQDALTAGKYINIDSNNEISVDRVVPNEAFTYLIVENADYTLHVTKSVDGVVTFEETYIPTTWDAPIDVTLDNAIRIYINLTGTMFYELVIASDNHDAGFKQNMQWFGRGSWTETFSTVDHTGEKLIVKSELDTAINAIKDGQSIDSFADVETALADKQDALTAGDYISIDANNEITVNREIPSVSASYELKTTSTSDPDINTDVIKRVNGEIVWQENYNYQTVRDNPVTIDDVFVLSYSGQWKYKLLVASDDHAAGYEQTWGWSAWVDYTENFSLVDNTGKKLIIKSELDTALTSKQNVTDNTLQTTDKTVPGAINELKSGLINVENTVSSIPLKEYKKATNGTAGNVVFTYAPAGTHRYTGLLFVTQNSGKSSIYAVHYFYGEVNSASKLSGDDVTIAIGSTDGNITVTLSQWATAVLITDAFGTFS